MDRSSRPAVHLYRARLDRSPAELSALRRLLSPDEGDRAARFHTDTDRGRWIVARAVLRILLARHLACVPERVRIERTAGGKPRLEPGVGAGLHFNVSHSGPLAVYALTRIGEVGVDIEEVRRIDEVEALARRFFSPLETEELLRLPPARREEAFLLGWTRKEALVKATGEGLARELSSFDVSLDPERPARLRGWRGGPGSVADWTLRNLAPGRGFVGAAAVRGANVQWRLRSWNGRMM